MFWEGKSIISSRQSIYNNILGTFKFAILFAYTAEEVLYITHVSGHKPAISKSPNKQDSIVIQDKPYAIVNKFHIVVVISGYLYSIPPVSSLYSGRNRKINYMEKLFRESSWDLLFEKDKEEQSVGSGKDNTNIPSVSRYLCENEFRDLY